MSVQPAIINLLENDVTVNGFVGGRIFTNTATIGVDSPYIVLEEQTGSSPGPSTLTLQVVMIRSYSVGGGGAKVVNELGQAIYDVLDKFKAVHLGVDFRGILLDDPNDSYIPPSEGESIGTHIREQKWNAWYTRDRNSPTQPA